MKTITIDSLARVEGHGGITVEVEDGRVRGVRVNIHEGPRLIEALVVGKTPEEDLNIVPRICAICTLSHKYAALRGLEKALGIEAPWKAKLTRDLMLLGEIMESHSLHVFLLSLPDFLGYPSAIAMSDRYAEEVKRGLELKQFAHRVMEITSARMIHGENPIIGGFGRYPTDAELSGIKESAQELVGEAERGIELLASLDYPSFMEEETVFMALNPPDDHYGFVGDGVLISTGEERSVEEYRELTQERVVPHSFAKRSRYNGRSFTVGALGRMILVGERLTGRAGEYFSRFFNQRWKKNPLFNNLAQAIEILYCLENIPELVDEIVKLEDPPIANPSRTDGEATGAVEAPRGTLYHHYKIEDGLISEADIVTPTAQNLDDIEKYIGIAAEKLISQGEGSNLELGLEMVARAYDPCISCSTH